MRPTLFLIPREFLGIPVFGFGWLLAVWLLSVGVIAYRVWRRTGWTGELRDQLLLAAVVAFIIIFVLPALLEPQGLPIRGYGVMLLLAVVAAVGLAIWRGSHRGFDSDFILSLAFWAFVSGIIGARLFYVVEYWSHIRVQAPSGQVDWLRTAINVFNVTRGGLVVYGSVIGGIAGTLVFLRWWRVPVWATLDLMAPSFMLGLAIGRLGCFLNGCCFGGVCELPWAVRFPAGSLAHVHQVQSGQAFIHGLKFRGSGGDPPIVSAVQPGSEAERQGLKPGQRMVAINGRPTPTVEAAQSELIWAHQITETLEISVQDQTRVYRWSIANQAPQSLPVHPSQLYSAFNALLLCLFLMACEPFCRHDGQVLAMMFTAYPVSRFILEIIRDDEPSLLVLGGVGLTVSQLISIVALVGAGLIWIYTLGAKPGKAMAALGAHR